MKQYVLVLLAFILQLIVPGREYVSEHECYELETSKKKVAAKRSKLYIFNDIILLATK